MKTRMTVSRCCCDDGGTLLPLNYLGQQIVLNNPTDWDIQGEVAGLTGQGVYNTGAFVNSARGIAFIFEGETNETVFRTVPWTSLNGILDTNPVVTPNKVFPRTWTIAGIDKIDVAAIPFASGLDSTDFINPILMATPASPFAALTTPNLKPIITALEATALRATATGTNNRYWVVMFPSTDPVTVTTSGEDHLIDFTASLVE